jgi:transcriptional regulator with XRE-family HTH domain
MRTKKAIGQSLESLGGKMRDLRAARGMTQRALAEALGVTTSTISVYERAAKTPPLETVVKLAELFDVSIDYLCGHDVRQRPITPADVINALEQWYENQIGNIVFEFLDADISKLVREWIDVYDLYRNGTISLDLYNAFKLLKQNEYGQKISEVAHNEQ